MPVDPPLFVYIGTPKSDRKTLARAVAESLPMANIVKHTTRAPKPGDVNGIDNHFVDDETFETMLASSEFADTTKNQNGDRFGIAFSEIQSASSKGLPVFMTTPNALDGLSEAIANPVIRIFVHKDREAYISLLREQGADAEELTDRLAYFDAKLTYGATCEQQISNDDPVIAAEQVRKIVENTRA